MLGRVWNGRGQRGQTIMEFAVIAPFIFLFLFVIVDFGIGLDHRLVLEHAVREGARYGAVNGDPAAVQTVTAGQAQNIINPNDVSVCYTDMNHDGTINVGDSVDVCVKYTYDPMLIRPIFKGFFGGSIGTFPMTVTGSARLEQQPTPNPRGTCPCPVPTVQATPTHTP